MAYYSKHNYNNMNMIMVVIDLTSVLSHEQSEKCWTRANQINGTAMVA